MPGEASRRNGQKGGRPKGRKDPHTLEREAVQRVFDQRVMRAADRLFNAQLSQAEGVSILLRRPKVGKGRTEVVSDPKTIQRYFDGELENDEADWYFIAVEKPNAEAADRLLNRGLGKPKESLVLGGSVGITRVIHEEASE